MEKVTKEQFIARLAFLASSACVYQNQNKPKSLVNIVRNLSCLLESLLWKTKLQDNWTRS